MRDPSKNIYVGDDMGLKVTLEFKLQDMWVGVYWSNRDVEAEKFGEWIINQRDVWICLIPTLPIHLRWRRRRWL